MRIKAHLQMRTTVKKEIRELQKIPDLCLQSASPKGPRLRDLNFKDPQRLLKTRSLQIHPTQKIHPPTIADPPIAAIVILLLLPGPENFLAHRHINLQIFSGFQSFLSFIVVLM
jgi:hypothetical protein